MKTRLSTWIVECLSEHSVLFLVKDVLLVPLARELAPCILSLGSYDQHGVRDIQETQLLVIYACFSKWQRIRIDIEMHI